jgi:hypothetical protein
MKQHSRTLALLAAAVLAAGSSLPASAQQMMGPGGYGGYGGQGPMMGGPGGGYWTPQGWWPGGPGGGPGPQGPWGQMPMMPGGPMMQGGQMMQGGPMMPWSQGYGPGPGPGLGMMAIVDANGDAVVSADEASVIASSHFDLLDPDGDDTVTRAEFLAAPRFGAMGGAMMQGPLFEQRRNGRFDTMDADSDGSVTFDEFLAAAQATYGDADADGDGTVTVWEFRSAHRPF